ncbi:unnamed protein product [Mytilus edulis]|uniref:DZIP3-like HEPN domain-containing protein n=1 Tax=Mytilus edulis TaxID=6550 RepID=A0A8S3Q2B4_MYTED|nr:unnamed protein product [Mytilus edulis]
MASNALSQEEENYVRMALLLTGISPRAVRVMFDKEFPPASLSFTVNDKNTKKKLNELRGKRVINQAQWNLLFPSCGITDSMTFDVTLMISLLRNLPTLPLVPPINGYDQLPVTTETTPSSDLARIKHYRNLLAHLHDGKTVLRLGGITMKQECDQLITKTLDLSSQETLRNLHQANVDIETIKQSIELIQTDNTEAGSKQFIEMVEEDMTTIQIEQDSIGQSHRLLQLDHLDTKMDVLSLQLDNEILKKSHDLLQGDSIKTRKHLKELASIQEEYVPKNRKACYFNHMEIVKLLLLEKKTDINKCAAYNMSSLLVACKNNHIDVVKLLLDTEVDIDKCEDPGMSPLFIASQNNHVEKADINKCLDNGESSLFIACYNNHIEVVEILLDRKADINKCKNDGVSPFFVACYNNHIEVVKILLDRKADSNKCKMMENLHCMLRVVIIT